MAQIILLRWVVGDNRKQKRTEELHRECGMLTVRQAMIMKVLVRGMKVLHSKKPKNLFETLTVKEDRHDRFLRSNSREVNDPRQGRY